jgi:hypothetical protein
MCVLCRAIPTEDNADWVLSTSHYGEDFVAAVCKGNTMATQFHPEKSGVTGRGQAGASSGPTGHTCMRSRWSLRLQTQYSKVASQKLCKVCLMSAPGGTFLHPCSGCHPPACLPEPANALLRPLLLCFFPLFSLLLRPLLPCLPVPAPSCCPPLGLNILRGFLEPDSAEASAAAAAANQRTLASLASPDGTGLGGTGLARRVIACLDVRSNDAGGLFLGLCLGTYYISAQLQLCATSTQRQSRCCCWGPERSLLCAAHEDSAKPLVAMCCCCCALCRRPCCDQG